MRKILIMAVTAIMAVGLMACSQNQKNQERKVPQKETGLKNNESSDVKCDSVSTEADNDTNVRGKTKKLDTNDFSGKITEVFYGNNNSLLIATDKNVLYLYDADNGKIKAKTEIQNVESNQGVDMRKIHGGYAMVSEITNTKSASGLSNFSSENKWLVIIYDEMLNEKKTVDVSKIIENGEDIFNSERIAVSDNGNNISVSTDGGLYEYDIQQKRKRKIVDFTKSITYNGLSIDEMEFLSYMKQDKKLVFLAGSVKEPAEEGEESIPAYGTVSLSDGKIEFTRRESYCPEGIEVRNNLIFMPEQFEKAQGKLLTVNIGDGKEKLISFSSVKEGKDGVYCSDNGRYFATAELEDTRLRVRIYDMANGKLIKAQDITDKERLYFARVPRIYMLDDLKTCVVIMGAGINEVKTKAEIFNY